MITGLAVRWALTAVFAVAGLTAALPRRTLRVKRSPQNGSRLSFAAPCARL